MGIGIRSMILLTSLCAWSAWADGVPTPPPASLLGEPEPYAEISRCLPANQIKAIDVINTRLLVIKGRNGKYWLNRLPKDCRGLRPNMSIGFSRRGSRVCASVRFQARDRLSELRLGPTTSCTFGPFEKVAREQIALLRRAES